MIEIQVENTTFGEYFSKNIPNKFRKITEEEMNILQNISKHRHPNAFCAA